MQQKNLIRGTITSAAGDDTSGLIVRAYAIGVRRQTLLNETTTDVNGTYSMTWEPPQSADGQRGNSSGTNIGIKVVTPLKKAELFATSADDVHFSASSRETFNAVLTLPIKPEVIEYDDLTARITQYSDRVKLADLEETNAHQDITILASSTRIPADKIEHLVLSQRLEQLSGLDGGFFYALLRKNTLLQTDLSKPLQIRLNIDLSSDPKGVLYDAVLADPKNIERDVTQAAKDSLVGSDVVKNTPKNLRVLASLKKEAETYVGEERVKRITDIVTQFVVADKIGEAAKLFNANRSDLSGVIKKIANTKFLGNMQRAKDLRVSLAIGELIGYDQHIISEVGKIHGINKPADLHKLAHLNKQAWEETLKKAAKNIKLGKQPLNKRLISLHASSLVRKMEKTYPTAAFAAQLERDKQPTVKHHKDIAALIKKHDELDLHKSNIDLFFKHKKLTTAKHKPVREELKKVQRVFRLTPNYAKASALMAANIGSARDITALGKTRFVKNIAPAAGISQKEAKHIYQKAQTTATAAMLVAGDMQDISSASHIAAFNTMKLADKVSAVSDDFPNLKTLFKGIDTCTCEECRSVYGPAAYLVDLLEFIRNRSVTDLTVTPHVTTNAAQDVLFARRADLADIDLNCPNANTPIPYIDLVCEQLEAQIAPDPGISFSGNLSSNSDPLVGAISPSLLSTLTTAGIPITSAAQVFHTEVASGSSAALPHYIRDTQAVLKAVNTGGTNYKIYQLRQTLSSADELAAAPAYVNAAAYSALAAANYAFTLPFDLAHTEATAYFSRFDIDRAQLMQNFQVSGVPDDPSIAAETLGLTASERALITNSDPSNQIKYWNAALADMQVVETFLDKTGLGYDDLVTLLTYESINAGTNLFIKHLDLTCDLTQKIIANLDNPALDRIHRFLRLQKITGWSLETTDQIISQTGLGAGALNDATLGIAATLVRLSQASGITIDQLAGCYGEFPLSLYTNIFLNKAKNGVVDDALKPENITGSGFLADVADSLCVCLQINKTDFATLLTLLTDNKLTIKNLSTLYLFTQLMRSAHLATSDIDNLIDLTAVDPTTSPANTLNFYQSAVASKGSALDLADVKFMLYHQADTIANLELSSDAILAALTSLQTAYQAAYAANKSPFDPNLAASEQQDALLKLLGQFASVTPDDTKAIVGFLSRTWSSAADAKTLIDNLFASLFDTTAIKAAIDALDALPPNADISAKSDDLLQSIMDACAAYQFLTAKIAILTTQMSTAFKTDPDTTATVLARAILKQPAPGTDAIQTILLTDSLIDMVNPTPVLPAITEGTFGQQYDALRLLHKLLPLVASYGLDPTTIDWLMTHSHDLGWLEWDAIPYKSGQNEVHYNLYVGLARILQLADQFTPVVNPADATNPITFWTVADMLLPASTATRDDFLTALALLTGYNQSDLDDIDAHFFAVFDLTAYRDPAVLERMTTSADYVRTLASPVSQITQFIKPTLIDDDTNKLRLALKSRYDETTWLDTLKEIMDAIRPQKRDALVAYMLATRPEFANTDDLYDYFLLDVEMQPVMPSSRIVQAHGTIQLFVQRCLMGLEPQAAADTENDSGWQHWSWLSQYRVREVNMQIFCYPENWIDASLRDDKSFIFADMQNELQQNDLSEDSAEQALTKYLEGLDDLAFLEVVATWYQSDIKTMHVFARTKGGDPATYYYRQFQQERAWTPWEKVDLEITGDQLLAFVRNNRLTLAWPIFSEEPNPDTESNVPDVNAGTLPADKPKRKLKIQLAISQLANGAWKPKKVSQDAVLTPSDYTDADLQQDSFNLMYIEWADEIILLKTLGQDSTELCGIFDIAGCKGYPELLAEGDSYFPDVFPDFKDTTLTLQRYLESNLDATDDLAARTALSPFNFYEILNQTPGTFRITYPHQMTLIDWVALLFEYLLVHSQSSAYSEAAEFVRRLKIPMGTLLPYFMEDSNHAYVITPGFYPREARLENNAGDIATENPANAVVKRTASDVLQLIEDIIALFEKYLAKLKGGESPSKVIAELLADDDYHNIVAEIKVYATLRYGEQFSNMYHPLVCALRKVLYTEGIPALMQRQVQLQQSAFNFDSNYVPAPIVPNPHPIEDIDFDSDGSYSSYNWEIFFHAPMLIASQLTQNQQFEQAMDWYHYIFNPTGALPGDAPQKYWVTKPFFLRNDSDYVAQRIDTLMYNIADPSTPDIKELEFAIQQWQDNPFKPHVVARYRTVAYQKAILMQYINNLIQWGDYLFGQDTMETITQATQMYILADKLLGPKPRSVPPVIQPPDETYNQIRAKLGPIGNALIDLENILPDLSVLPEHGAELPPGPLTLATLYFCIPQNEQMLSIWDTVADRLFKIRNSEDINGVPQTLSLFAPPIDPGALVRAAAAGLDISSVIAGLNAPLPYYRFTTLAQKASDLAGEVRTLGNSLLQALEKKDGEAMARLRSELEIRLLNAISDIKTMAIQESKDQIEILNRTRKVTDERHTYYMNIQKISTKEQLNLDKLSDAHDLGQDAQISRTLAGVVGMIPSLLAGASGFGGSPHVTLKWGGENLAAAANSAADVLNILSAAASYEANRASTIGGYDRRWDDWQLQMRLAQKELDSIDTQIDAAKIRQQMAVTDQKNHALQIDNAQQLDKFMHTKYTNQELYQWMVGQISSVYFSAYKLAFDMAKKAERSYQFELGRDDTFISYGYWDNMKKGLQSADGLIHDIKRMDAAYLDNHKREYEITKHISLAALDPLALAQLKASGSCDFTVPEELFDLDHAGQYFRRTKSVSISLPCIAGPQTSVSAKLSLVSNKYRQLTNPDNMASTGYAEDPGNDERFVYNVGAIQSIATGNGQQDSGMFELNFRDERYLPFEGTGAISSWRLELPNKALAQFDYDTIANVVLHLNYTSRDGGSSLRTLAETNLLDRLATIQQGLSETGLHVAINMTHEMPNEWNVLKSTGTVEATIDTTRLPYLAQTLNAAIDHVVVLAKVTGNPATFAVTLDGGSVNLSRIDAWKLCKANTTDISLGTPFTLSLTPTDLTKLENLVFIVKYVF